MLCRRDTAIFSPPAARRIESRDGWTFGRVGLPGLLRVYRLAYPHGSSFWKMSQTGVSLSPVNAPGRRSITQFRAMTRDSLSRAIHSLGINFRINVNDESAYMPATWLSARVYSGLLFGPLRAVCAQRRGAFFLDDHGRRSSIWRVVIRPAL